MSSPTQNTLRVSPSLKAFLARVHAQIEADEVEPRLDAFQSETTFGGPSDDDSGLFEFTHFAEHGRCRFVVSAAQIGEIARGAVARIDVARDAMVPAEVDEVAADKADDAPDLASVIMAALSGGAGAKPQEDPRALKFIELLINMGAVELCEGAHPAEIVIGVKKILELDEKPKHKAKALSEWLFEQDGIVEEVYIDDRKLAKLIWSW